MPTTDPAVSGLAWSPTADPAADWWNARVYFDGVPTRRLDAAAAFSRTPGATDRAVRAFLASAEPVGPAGDARPPWYWDEEVYFDGAPTPRRRVRVAMAARGVPPSAVMTFLDTAQFAGKKSDIDPAGRWATVGHQHIHINAAGEPDAGGGGPVRAILAKSGRAGAGKKDAPPGDDDPEFRKAVNRVRQTEARHAGTLDKLAAGEKVSDKSLKAAHEHYTKWHGYHTEDMKRAAGADGIPKSGKEFEHGFHKDQAEKIGKHLAATTGELKSRQAQKDRKEAEKVAARRAKDDARHGGTWDKHSRGEKVTRAALQAAHDHYKSRYDADGESLAKLAGKDGKNLLSIPPEHHGKLVDSMLEASGRQDKLKEAIDAHDKAKADRAAAKEKARADKLAAVAEKRKADKGPKPGAKAGEKAGEKAGAKGAEKPAAPEGTKLPPHEIKKGIARAFAAAADAGMTSLPKLFAAARREVPGLTKEQFHEHALALEKSGHLELHAANEVQKIHPEDLPLGIKSGPDGDRLKYWAVSGRRSKEPWAHGEHDGAADAAHKLVESGARNASPPSRADLFNAMVHGGAHPAAAGAAAREVHAKLAETGAVGQHDVRDAVNRHHSDDERKAQDATTAALGRAGTNHSAGGLLSALYEERTNRSGHTIGQVSKKELPSKDEVAKRIEVATHGRLAGKSALSAAKDVHAHVLAHGHDFMSGHDFAGILDRHAKNDYKHSSHEDVSRAVRAGESVHPKHLERAQNEAGAHYQKANSARMKLLDRVGGDSSKLAGKDRAKWEKLSSQAAKHGDHIDTINGGLIRHREGDAEKVEASHADMDAQVDRFRALNDFGPDDGDSHTRVKAEADKVMAGVRAKHTDAEILSLAKLRGLKPGRSVDKAMKLMHNDLTAVSRLRETQRV